MNPRIFFVLVATLAIGCARHARPVPEAVPPAASRGTSALVFEQNKGQAPSAYSAILHTSRFDAAFHRAGVLFALKDASVPTSAANVALTFPGAQPVEPATEAALAGRVNYLRGTNPRAWTTGVPTFGRLAYRQLYPGIDLVFYGNEQRLEYDFVIAPGADPSRIALKFDATAAARLTPEGDLVIGDCGGTMAQQRPVAYQEPDGRRMPVDAAYAVDANGVVTLRLGAYDRSAPLTIDPIIVLSTYFGGSGGDLFPRFARQAGSLYLAGETCSTDFPTLNALQPAHTGVGCDGFLSKLTGDGASIVYSTYFGGSSMDFINGLAVDASGAAYVAGYTSSTDFPTTAGAFDRTCGNDGMCGSTDPFTRDSDGFVAKISADGSTLIYSTYIGGSISETVLGIAVNGAGEAAIVGQTGSADFPTTPGAPDRSRSSLEDAFVTKLSADGSTLVYSTYFGGNGNVDVGIDVAFDPSGNVYVAGATDSTDLPVVGAFQPSLASITAGIGDGFILKLSPGGAIAFSTYFGGDSQDSIDSVAFDATGVYVAGYTNSTTVPGHSTPHPSANDYAAFVAQIAGDGSHVIATQLIDGNHSDRAGKVVITRFASAPIVNVVGVTGSTDLPTTADAIQQQLVPGGNGLFFATLQLDAGGRLAAPTFLTYIGGSGGVAWSTMASDGADGMFLGAGVNGAFPRINASAPISGTDAIVIVHIVPPNRWTESMPGELHLYAANATAVGSEWSVISDSSAAAGRRVANVDRSVPKLATPMTSPPSYVEFTFDADAGTAYRLWVRGIAAGNSYNNDSVYAQFSDSIDAAGHPLWRIGSSSATSVILEDCTGCGVHGWGWNDNGYGAGVLGAVVRFAATGHHTLRFQAREDGLSIDQVVLSSVQYLGSAPGLARDDTRVLKRTATPPAGESCTVGEVVLYPGVRSSGAGSADSWHSVPDSTAAGGARMFYPDHGAPKVVSPLANPASWFEVDFAADANVDYRVWIRGKAQNDYWGNDSVWLQFGDSIDASGQPIWRTQTTSATWAGLEDCSGCGMKSWGWQDNGYGTGVFGPVVRFATSGGHTLRVQLREDGFSIDQIVLSSGRYLSASPGALKNDATLLPECAAPPLR
jgi:Beta-propeller repeat